MFLTARKAASKDTEGTVFISGKASQLAGADLPYVLVGHSRGGVSAILFAGRQTVESPLPKPAGVITAGSPDFACDMSDGEKDELRRKGFLESPSARTGQILRIGLAWLTEQEADRDAHNVLDNVRRIECRRSCIWVCR